jgi:hypothetical protein
MNVKELIEVLKSFPEDQEVELAIVAPVEGADEITVDRYPVDAVMPWNDEEEGQEVIWLVGGEDDDIDEFLDALEDESEDGDGA